jgi:hypothetical protein
MTPYGQPWYLPPNRPCRVVLRFGSHKGEALPISVPLRGASFLKLRLSKCRHAGASMSILLLYRRPQPAVGGFERLSALFHSCSKPLKPSRPRRFEDEACRVSTPAGPHGCPRQVSRTVIHPDNRNAGYQLRLYPSRNQRVGASLQVAFEAGDRPELGASYPSQQVRGGRLLRRRVPLLPAAALSAQNGWVKNCPPGAPLPGVPPSDPRRKKQRRPSVPFSTAR